MKKASDLDGRKGNRELEKIMKKFKEKQRRDKGGENESDSTLDVELQRKIATQLSTLHA